MTDGILTSMLDAVKGLSQTQIQYAQTYLGDSVCALQDLVQSLNLKTLRRFLEHLFSSSDRSAPIQPSKTQCSITRLIK